MSAPAEFQRHMGQDAVDDTGVVVDAELVRHGEQQGVGGCDGLQPRLFAEELRAFARLGT
nr:MULTISPECIES: hypothetical protein [Streptomyces]